MVAADVALLCKALGDTNRLQIVQMLSDGEKCGCKLLETVPVYPAHPFPSHEDSLRMWAGHRPQGGQMVPLLAEPRNL